jgi:SAM-dependent methyltransferase
LIDSEIRSRGEFEAHLASDIARRRYTAEQKLARAWQADSKAYLQAWCAACDAERPLLVDSVASTVDENGNWLPNWRERLICTACGLNTRQRLMIDHLAQSLEGVPVEQRAETRLYATEQISPFYDWLWAHTGLECVGSEFLGPEVERGSYTPIAGREVRHENVEALSFEDEAIDFLFSNDVLEHVDQPETAVHEMARVLRPGGELFLSVPFSPYEALSRRRARLTTDGIEHLVEPEYHHDPLSEQGALVFFNFGWDLLQWMRDAGLKNPHMRVSWSEERGYLGSPLFYFHAVKPLPKWWHGLLKR